MGLIALAALVFGDNGQFPRGLFCVRIYSFSKGQQNCGCKQFRMHGLSPPKGANLGVKICSHMCEVRPFPSWIPEGAAGQAITVSGSLKVALDIF